MDNWSDEDWRTWAEATRPGTWLLDKGEKVVMREPTIEECEAFSVLVADLQEKYGRKPNA